MNKSVIIDQIERKMKETEGNLGGWADGIDGLLVGGDGEEFEVGCDRKYPNFENGNYVCSLRLAGEWVADVVVDGGSLSIDER